MSECRSTAGLPAGYFGDLAAFDYLPQFGPLLGGHIGSGPPSGAGTLGAAAATYVLTSATIRNIALIARFIGFSPCVETAKSLRPNTRPHYTVTCQVSYRQFRSLVSIVLPIS